MKQRTMKLGEFIEKFSHNNIVRKMVRYLMGDNNIFMGTTKSDFIEITKIRNFKIEQILNISCNHEWYETENYYTKCKKCNLLKG